MGSAPGAHLHVEGTTVLHRLPAHVKLVGLVAFVLAVVSVTSSAHVALGALLAVGVAVLLSTRVPARHLLPRLAVETPFAVFALVLPFVAVGPQTALGPFTVSQTGLTAAVALLLMGIRNLVRKPAPKKDETDGGIGPGRAFGLGVVLMVTNVTTLALYFPLVHEISTDGASPAVKAVVFAIASLIVMIPAAGPPLVVSVLGDRADPGLKRMNTFVTAHHQTISAAVCFLFALVLGIPALRNLL